MTRSNEKGENEITRAVRREAKQTGVSVEVILTRLLNKAKKAKDVKRQQKIIAAQKYLRQRNRKKRRGGR
jgi:hypothetical protein